MAIWLALAGGSANAQMTLVPDATNTPAQMVIVPFYYAEAPYTTDIVLTNHGATAAMWALHFKEAENGREASSCCAAPNTLPGASYVVLESGKSLTLHASSTSGGTITATHGPGACTYPFFPAAGVPIISSDYTGANADTGNATQARALHGHVELVPAADIWSGSALAASLQTGDCAHLVPASDTSSLLPPSGGITASTKITGTLGVTTVQSSGVNGFTTVNLLTPPGSLNPSLAQANDPGLITASAIRNVGGTDYVFSFSRGEDAVSAVFTIAGTSAQLISKAGRPVSYLGITYPAKRYYTDPLFVASAAAPFEELFGGQVAGQACIGVDVAYGSTSVFSGCGDLSQRQQGFATNLINVLPQAGNLSPDDLLVHLDPSHLTAPNFNSIVVGTTGTVTVSLQYAIGAFGTEGALTSDNMGPVYGQAGIPFVLSFSPGPSAKLSYAQQPATVVAGANIAPAVKVLVTDTFGNLETASTAPVTMALSTNPGGASLGGTKVVNAVGGVATFSNLILDKYGIGYKLSANGSGLTSATSNAFDVQAKLAFTTQPTNVIAGSVMGHNVVVQMHDVNGAVISGTPTITLVENPSGEVASHTNAVNGVATFSGVALFVAGSNVTLTASGPGLVSATSVPFNVTAGAPTQLAFMPQPGNAVVDVAMPTFGVRVLDANNNLTDSTAQVTIALGTNPTGATLSGTKMINAVAGMASFSTLMLDKLGTGYTLKASASGLAGATSSPFNVSGDKIFANGFQ